MASCRLNLIRNIFNECFFSSFIIKRLYSSNGLNPIDSSKLKINLSAPLELLQKPPVDQLIFGKIFTDHLLRISWRYDKGWSNPVIQPFSNFSFHPGSKVFHYAQELFEGMKAYRGVDDKIRLFRPMHNMVRMNVSAERSCLPQFDGKQLLNCIRRLIQIEQEWVPHASSSSLYIRPSLIGTEPTLGIAPSNEAELFVILGPTGPYFSTGIKPVNLLADIRWIRAWPGGSGFTKMGSNYAPTLWVQKFAESVGCHQCLWLFGEDEEITEVGAMNIFIVLKNSSNQMVELVTPALNGTILPGVTRRSALELALKWTDVKISERKITMPELINALAEGHLLEVFGVGTAAIVSPVGGIYYRDFMHKIPTPMFDKDAASHSIAERIKEELSDIYYGRITPHPWAIDIEEWDTFDFEQDTISTESMVQGYRD